MQEESTLSHVQVAQKVFKSKSRDRVVGFGGGITLKEISEPHPSREELQSKLNEANKQNHILTNAWTQYKRRTIHLRAAWVQLKMSLKYLKICCYNGLISLFQERTLQTC